MTPRDLPTVGHNETFRAMSYLFPFSLTGLTIEFKVYTPGVKIPVAVYTLNDNLEIDPSESKRLRIKEHDVTIEPGNYIYRIKLNPNGIRATYVMGNWTILDNG